MLRSDMDITLLLALLPANGIFVNRPRISPAKATCNWTPVDSEPEGDSGCGTLGFTPRDRLSAGHTLVALTILRFSSWPFAGVRPWVRTHADLRGERRRTIAN